MKGELSHKDSLGNAHILCRRQSQYMNAGTNVGKIFARNPHTIEVDTPEQLRQMGTKKVLFRIRMQCDLGTYLHILYGIQGAIEGSTDKLLSS